MPVVVSIATLLVLILTLYWAREYTLVARRQYEAGYRQIVVLEIIQGETNATTVAVTGVQFRNVGLEPALDIEMSDWAIGGYLVEWDDPPRFLAKDTVVGARFLVSRNGQTGGFARDVIGLGQALQENPANAIDRVSIPFTIRYRDAAGGSHMTEATLERTVVTGQIHIRYESLQ